MASSSNDGGGADDATRQQHAQDLAQARLIRERGERGLLALDQVERAKAQLQLQPGRRLRFPQPALHGIVRYMLPGQLVVLAAQTGLGKSTFLLSMTDDWVEQGYKVAYLGLEQEDWDLRQQFACLRAGVPRVVAAENSWEEHPEGARWFEAVERELDRQLELPLLDRLLLLPQRYITLDTLNEAAAQAVRFGADVMIVDHIHQIEGAASYREFSRIVQRSKQIAEEGEMVLLAAAQLNRAGLVGGHRLTRYMPAQLQHIQGGGVIEQNAALVLNLWRPVIVPVTKADEALLEAAKHGDIEPRLVLQPNKMGVVTLKHRKLGSLEGRRCVLTLAGDKIIDPTGGEEA